MILYRSIDLLFGSRIHGVCAGQGIAVRPCRSEAQWERMVNEGLEMGGLVVEVEEGDEGANALIRRARRERPDLPIIAFGGHVNVHALEEAREAGANEVMARGVFAGRMASIVARLARGGGNDEAAP